MEKEALTKGTPVGQSHDIEIPPPRPKRKSTCPYPRNTAAGSLSPLEEANDGKALHSTPLRSGKQVLCVDVDTSHEVNFSKFRLFCPFFSGIILMLIHLNHN